MNKLNGEIIIILISLNYRELIIVDVELPVDEKSSTSGDTIQLYRRKVQRSHSDNEVILLIRSVLRHHKLKRNPSDL